MQIFSSLYTSQARMSRKIRRSVDIVRSGGTWSRSGVAELPAIKKQVPWEWDNKSLLLLLRTFYFGLYCLELLKDLPVEDLFNVCCSIICVVCASVCILCTILFIFATVLLSWASVWIKLENCRAEVLHKIQILFSQKKFIWTICTNFAKEQNCMNGDSF